MNASQVGNYKLIRPLGEGGMGVVYEAEHISMRRRAAVKVLRPELIKDEQAIGRLFNEARATNEIRHPGIVQIYDCGTMADGSPWLIMELLEGETLGRRLSRLGRLSPAEAVDLGVQAASVLAAAHDAGIVHRDLKPDNLFIAHHPESPAGERVKVLDFGIAKLSGSSAGMGLLRTQTGVLIGTPVYMSPEQCRGTRQIDARSDIYSLGLILYQMLAGEPPFISNGIGELFHLHMNVPATRLEQRNDAVEPRLAHVVHKALEKDPAARFQSMAELQQALLGRIKVGSSQTSGPIVSTADRGGAPISSTIALPGTVTTLSGTTGERRSGSARRRARALPWVVGGMLAATAAVVVVGIRAGRQETPPVPAPAPATAATTPPPPAPPVPAPAPVAAPARRTVTIEIETSPAEARVVDAADGRLVGISPVREAMEMRQADLKLRIEKDGYAPRTVKVPLRADFKASLKLKRAAAAPPEEPGAEHIIKL